jgi:hypothetical protein
MDAQLVEILGRHRLIAELLRANLEVAIPARDRGIDRIVYADLGTQVTRFSACPTQGSHRRLVLSGSEVRQVPEPADGHVWHLEDPVRTVTYATTHPEAVAVADAMGYTKTSSWEKGLYVTTRPSPHLVAQLEPFRMTPQKWWEKIMGCGERVSEGSADH